ncbi:energy transducer TonB [Chryseobacterium sp. POE27]|uniref:energy transducer TonB n=1 Tax=Chryseobacterium sp. POE27 TaxID=3138177 RepID=UPI00321A6AA7
MLIKQIIVCISLVVFTATNAQEIENKIVEKITIDESNKPAEYPGGINAFRNNFSRMLNVAKIDEKGTVKSEIQLVISEDGSVTDIKVIGDNKSMNKEMERVMKTMSKTKWTPAMINNIPVKYRSKLPITMNLE